MNKLFILENMGFNITWKLINVGVNKLNHVSVFLTYEEIIDYLEIKLSENEQDIDKYISLVCYKDNFLDISKLIAEFSEEDMSDIKIQVRKWRAYCLKELLDNISCDHLQGLLQLIEFWVSSWYDNDCPMSFPENSGFFTDKMYESLVKKNHDWLNDEIAYIIDYEG